MQRKRLIYNTALLTFSSLLMSFIGMAFQVWLVGCIGSTGIGLYQLVVSVTNLSATFAISGIRFATTRLVSEELGLENMSSIGSAMRRCLIYGSIFGIAAFIIMYQLAEPLGFLWICDARTVLSLRISALSMPCISLCAVLSGYFTANGRVWKPTLIHLIEQLLGIALVALFLEAAPRGDIEKSCAAVTLGRLGADVLSLLMMYFAYKSDHRIHYTAGSSGEQLTARMFKIAVPLAVSAYARSALTTLQNLLVPRGLKSAGFSSDGALSGYGTIQGMVLPIILFPSCIMSSLSELIVPELTESQVQNDSKGISRSVSALIRMSLTFSIGVASFMFVFADMLGLGIYKSSEAGYYIRILAPLIPIMYTDMTIDGCLKGLGQQVWSMGINIVDAAIGLILVWYLLPKYALTAYIAIIYFTEILNFVLSIYRLTKVNRFDRKHNNIPLT
ncbi:MAG: polysaccharide biosynthesis C-terminal domain-containing protein [Oscillospiraceae bacterium]|nr:polysaccharide biosynthesis C-terminal domain-containing protein [Oscillospiraceae bacterium]